jgi:hypothetical protein
LSYGIKACRKKEKAGANITGPGNSFLGANARLGEDVSCFYAARFLAAHLFFIASLIRLRADADKWRFTPPFDWAGGRPGPRFRPCKAVMAALRRSRSACNASMIVAVSMLLLGDNECTDCTCAEEAFGIEFTVHSLEGRRC